MSAASEEDAGAAAGRLGGIEDSPTGAEWAGRSQGGSSGETVNPVTETKNRTWIPILLFVIGLVWLYYRMSKKKAA